MKFFTKYERPEKVLEPGGGEVIVEAAGYIPAEVQITEMLNAGMKLGEYRKERYDFDSEESVEDDFIDPTRSAGFDLADASRLDREAEIGLKKTANDVLEESKKMEEEQKRKKAGEVEDRVGKDKDS